MIGNAPDIDAVDDVVQDVDKLRQRHRDCEIHDIFNDTPLEKSFCVLKHLQTLFFLFWIQSDIIIRKKKFVQRESYSKETKKGSIYEKMRFIEMEITS